VVGPHHFLAWYDTSNAAEEAKVRTTCEALGYTWKYIPKHRQHKCVNEAATSLEECIDPIKFDHSKVSPALSSPHMDKDAPSPWITPQLRFCVL
jgi:hypothetical protein